MRLGRAGTLNTLGELQKADELLAIVAEHASDAGRPDLRARARIGSARIATKQGRGADALSAIADAETISEELNDLSLQARTGLMAAYVRWWFEEAGDAAVADLRRCLAIAEQLDEPGLLIEVRNKLGTLLYNIGDLAGADEHFTGLIALAGEAGSVRDQARATCQLALVKYHLGALIEAEELSLQASDWLERTGDRFNQLQNLRTLALCAAARSDFELADERLRAAVPLALEVGGALVVEIYRILVDVLISLGRLDDARELAVFAFRSVPEEDAYARAAGLLIEASLRTAEGRADIAIESFAKALQLLEQQGLPLDLGEARLAYGRALRRLGDEVAARTELGRAREGLSKMGALGLVDEIDRELARLAEEAGLAGPLASA